MTQQGANILRFSRSTGGATHDVVPSIEILGVRLDCPERTALTRLMTEFVRLRRRGWISYLNVHAINLAYRNESFRNYLNSSLLTYCDGQGLRLGASILGASIPERIAMSDWIYDVALACEANDFRLFLLGSTVEVQSKATIALKGCFPRLLIVGSMTGYFEHDRSQEIVETIDKAKPDILVVGMGMPLQEEWIQRNFAKLNVQIVLNAGSCFDFVAGIRRRSPQWMGTFGLEWLYRLFQEPGRLWKRYLLGNPAFLFRVLRQRLSFSTTSHR